MSDEQEAEEIKLSLEEVQRRAAAVTRELGNANYTRREHRRELQTLKATLDTLVQERTRELELANARLRESSRLRSLFSGID